MDTIHWIGPNEREFQPVNFQPEEEIEIELLTEQQHEEQKEKEQ